MAEKVLSRNEKLQKNWLNYFKNIEKENELIRALLRYYKDNLKEINKLANKDTEKTDNDIIARFSQEKKEANDGKILPENTDDIPDDELRSILYNVHSKIGLYDTELKTPKTAAEKVLFQGKKFFEIIQKFHNNNVIPKSSDNAFTSLYLGNFKGFADENGAECNTIDIKPITLLYGPNSYGKSSVLQSLLLLHQTVRDGEDYQNITLLANGKLVKLGTFKDFINKKDIQKDLKIELTMHPFHNFISAGSQNLVLPEYNTEEEGRKVINRKSAIFQTIKQKTSVLSQISVCLYFRLENDAVSIPQIDIYTQNTDYSDTNNIIKEEKVLAYTLMLKDNQTKDKIYELLQKTQNKIFEKITDKNEFPQTSFFKVEDFIVGKPFEQLEKIIKGIVYVSSYRAPAERYYIPEKNRRPYVGKNGEYTAEILGYDKNVQKKVNDWLYNIAKYKLSFKNNTKNKEVSSINLDDKTTNLDSQNLLDLGSGIAQVLPIITQAFKSQNDMILIEEPEIHLHPRAQAEMGAMFAEAINEEFNNTFIIETHSENLLLRLQKLIRKGKLSKDDVSVFYIDKDEPGSCCIPLELDKKGYIRNIMEVPNGFFEEGFNELFDVNEE